MKFTNSRYKSNGKSPNFIKHELEDVYSGVYGDIK